MNYGYVRPLYDDKMSENQLKKVATFCEEIFTELHGSPKKRIELEKNNISLEICNEKSDKDIELYAKLKAETDLKGKNNVKAEIGIKKRF